MYLEGVHWFVLSSVLTSQGNFEQVRILLQKLQQAILWQVICELHCNARWDFLRHVLLILFASDATCPTLQRDHPHLVVVVVVRNEEEELETLHRQA